MVVQGTAQAVNIKIGNKVTLRFTVTDTDGNLITNLGTAIDVKFMVKQEKDDTNAAALISKSLGAGVTVDDPTTGKIAVVIESTDYTLITEAGSRYIATQIEYSATDKQEINIRVPLVDECGDIILDSTGATEYTTIDQVNFTKDIIRES